MGDLRNLQNDPPEPLMTKKQGRFSNERIPKLYSYELETVLKK